MQSLHATLNVDCTKAESGVVIPEFRKALACTRVDVSPGMWWIIYLKGLTVQ
jgi:hypothetical protein